MTRPAERFTFTASLKALWNPAPLDQSDHGRLGHDAALFEEQHAREELARRGVRIPDRPVHADDDAISVAAQELDRPFAGHVSADVGLQPALAAGQASIDHLDGRRAFGRLR